MPTLVTKRHYYLQLILLAILGLPLTAFAQQVVQYDFSGNFYSGSPPVLGVQAAGQAYTGTMSYDSSLTSQLFPYYNVPTQYNITLDINGNTFVSNGFQIVDIPNQFLSFTSAGQWVPYATLLLNGSQVQDPSAGFSFVFYSNNQNSFASLPTSISTTGTGFLYANNNQETDAFTITNINAVPEPGEYMLMLMGFGLTGLFAARRKKTA